MEWYYSLGIAFLNFYLDVGKFEKDQEGHWIFLSEWNNESKNYMYLSTKLVRTLTALWFPWDILKMLYSYNWVIPIYLLFKCSGKIHK